VVARHDQRVLGRFPTDDAHAVVVFVVVLVVLVAVGVAKVV
jgi:hypothetical protein